MGLFGKNKQTEEEIIAELKVVEKRVYELANTLADDPSNKAVKKEWKEACKRGDMLKKKISPSIWKQALAADVATATKKKTEKREKKEGVIRCPHCNSLEVQFMKSKIKGSFGKAALATVVTDSVTMGTIAGVAGGKNINEFFCKGCNKTFDVKVK